MKIEPRSTSTSSPITKNKLVPVILCSCKMSYTNVGSENLTNKDVEYLYHHVFLPAELPDGDDNCPEDERLLMGFVHHSLESFLMKADPEAGAAIKACSVMIKRLQKSKNAHGFLSAGGVQDVLQQLSLEGIVLQHILTQILTHRTSPFRTVPRSSSE